MEPFTISQDKVYAGSQASVMNYFPAMNNHIYVLDLGCGSGVLGSHIKKRYDATVVGVTISESERLIAVNALDECLLFNLEEGLPSLPNNYFDVVILSHVLEHICYPQKLLEAIKLVLKPEGIVIIALPNIMHYKSRFKLTLGIFEYTETGIYDYTHFRWYTYRSAVRLFQKHKYRVILKDVVVTMPVGRITNHIFNERIKGIIKSFLKLISKGFFGWELIYILKK